MQNRNNNNSQVPNKGFTLHLDQTYVGFLTISDKVPEATAIAMQDPETMKAILEQVELRPYAPKESQDVSGINAIIAATVHKEDVTTQQ